MMNDPRNPLAFQRPAAIGPSSSQNAIKIIAAVIAILVALLLGLIVLVLIGVETGPVALLIGLISATLPVPIYLGLALWIDRYEAEPFWMLATAFFWGALIAVFFAFLINTSSATAVAILTNSLNAGRTFGAVISAPIVEESAKAIILFIFFFWKKDEFDGVIDGIVYAAMSGLGFAMTENVQYYGNEVYKHGTQGLTLIFILRGVLMPFSHPLFTSLTGIGLGLARQSRNTAVKLIAPVLGLMAAMSMHSIWNGSGAIFGGLAFFATYILIMIPAFFILLVVIFLALRREGQIVREYLIADFQAGLLTPQEFSRLCSVTGRMGTSFDALTRGGFGHWRAARQFNQTASELAFHRSRVARGISSQDALERETAYRLALIELLKRLRTK
jgi:RsiW-degrading membrane proteinase PrsW (M82 family)